jgi:hypothetical protein
MNDRIVRIKNNVVQHVKDHKELYTGVVVGVVIGGVTVYLANLNSGTAEASANVKNNVIGNWKPEVHNNTTIIQELVRRGHPGFRIRNVETGEEFASIKRAADMYGIGRRTLQRHLDGSLPSAGGHVFENLGEMA